MKGPWRGDTPTVTWRDAVFTAEFILSQGLNCLIC